MFNKRKARTAAYTALLAATLLAVASVPTTASTRAVDAGTDLLGRNLIVNGDAEAGPAASDGGVVPSIPGWTFTFSNFTVVPYGAPDGFPTASDPGPANRGANFFSGGPNNPSSGAGQVIDVSESARLIDTGRVTFDLSAYLGGFDGQGDNAVVSVAFQNGIDVFGNAVVGPVTTADRSSATGLLAQVATGLVPRGTREIHVAIQMTKGPEFFYNDGYADNISLVLDQFFGRNLVTNGDAESGSGSPDPYVVVPVPGWTITGNFTAVRYGAEGVPQLTDPGPPERGMNFFAGGPDNASSSASQRINVGGVAHLIDTSPVTYTLSGYLGGFEGQGDNAIVSMTFMHGDQVLGSDHIGPVTPEERFGATGLLTRSAEGVVPAGTRVIIVVIHMTRAPVFFYNDGYADNISLVLNSRVAGAIDGAGPARFY